MLRSLAVSLILLNVFGFANANAKDAVPANRQSAATLSELRKLYPRLVLREYYVCVGELKGECSTKPRMDIHLDCDWHKKWRVRDRNRMGKQICQGFPYFTERIRTRPGNNCGYSLTRLTCVTR